MYTMSTILLPLLQLVSLLFIARALLSWFPIDRDSGIYPAYLFVHRVTEPVLAPVRSVMPRLGGIDLSILVVLVRIKLLLTPLAASL